jgi:hypothetical protein
LRIQPPELKNVASWDELSVREQSQLIGYEQIREYEEVEMVAASAGVKL